MSEPELEKLLGGFAADTLTAEERTLLYTAALHDQQLFNALANEQVLKELLADPAVRRRLLHVLNQTSASVAGRSRSWMDWFRRPAGLAWAGGLAAAVFAVVLGTKIYQDSLQQAAQSVANEETTPAAPPAPSPPVSQPAPPLAAAEPQVNVNEAPAKAVAKKNAPLDKIVKRERAALPTTQGQRASDAVRDLGKPRGEQQDDAHRQADAPVAEPGKAAEGVSAPKDQTLAASAPPASAPAPAPMQAPVGSAATGAVAPPASARTLFYDGVASRPDAGMMAQEKERAMRPLAESSPQIGRLERKNDQFALTGKTAGTATPLKPLGLRYSFVIRGADGQDREVDVATAIKSGGHPRLLVEANQDTYLQIWKSEGSSTPQLLFPEKDTGLSSIKIIAGQRQTISLPTERGTVTFTALLSRVPLDPLSRQETALLNQPSPDQLQESITASGPTGLQEQAIYVVNHDSSISQLSVNIPVVTP